MSSPIFSTVLLEWWKKNSECLHWNWNSAIRAYCFCPSFRRYKVIKFHSLPGKFPEFPCKGGLLYDNIILYRRIILFIIS